MRISASECLSSDHKISGIKYRPDIDGLRAIAVLPVVLYHAELLGMKGGFVGVDVFFVISGFVITSLIIAEIDDRVFSIVNFYLRRMRRIFPALFVVLAFCAIVGWYLLVPGDYRSLGQSIVSTSLFVSNMFFWRTAGYFAAQPNALPLLHTWSLGVEEQFYLVLPLFLVALCRFLVKRRTEIIFAICAASFAIDVAMVKLHPNAAFYLAPFRIWELLIGALLALGATWPAVDIRWKKAGGPVGISLLAIAMFGFSSDTGFPGIAALLPTTGAAMVIWSGTGFRGGVTRLLSTRPAIFFGRISYSFYLWHFPLLAFSAYVPTYGLSVQARIAAIICAVVFAMFSYRYIEQPVRQGQGPFGSRTLIFVSAALALTGFAGFGLAAATTNGFPGRFSSVERSILNGANDFRPDRAQCINLNALITAGIAVCNMGTGKVAPQFALMGDSHAEAMRGPIDDAATNDGQAGVLIAENGCPPLIGVENPGEPQCAARNDLRFKYVLSRPSIHTLILAARWGLWAEGTRFKHESGPRVHITYLGSPPVKADNHAAFAAGLERTIATLVAAHKKVWLVGPVPEIGYDVPRALYFESLGLPIDVRPTYEEFLHRQQFVLQSFIGMSKKYSVAIAWPHRQLCDRHLCQVRHGPTTLYLDHSHLNISGAMFVSGAFGGILQHFSSLPRD